MPIGGTAFAAAEASNADETIIVQGERALAGVHADTELDENAIAAYGADTVGDLLGALAAGPDASGEGPFILINGEPASGLEDIADLPAEAASRIQLLSRNAASALGQRPTRRVINVIIKPDHRQLTLNAKGKLATAGEGWQGDGEVNLLRLDQGNRRSLVLRVLDRDSLLEADRNIVGAAGATPFDPLGNIVAFPLAGAEIDPVLSALAGQVVTVAGVPVGTTSPTLAGFAGQANLANTSDLGRYRTLVPQALGVSANANVTQKFGPSILSLTLRGERQESESRIGAATAGLHLPASSPFSPFGRDVTLATIFGDPQRQNSHFTNLTAAAVLNGPIGRWRYSVNANMARRSTATRSQSGYDLADLQAAIDAGTANPFLAPDSLLLGPQQVDRSKGIATNGGVQATLTGSPFKLPAGPVRAAFRFEGRFNHARSTTDSGSDHITRRLRRDEEVGALNLQLPVINSKQIGAIGLELSGALHRLTASDWLHDTGYGLNWDPSSRLSVRAAVNNEQIAPSPNALNDPVVILQNVRTYDFIRQETVFVAYLTGGNPNLGVERRRTTSVGLSWQPLDDADLSVTADYQRFRGRNASAALPPVNADVQAAFPDRFQRDLSGRLIAVDARPVPFQLVRRDELRWGATFSRNFGAQAATGKQSSEDAAAMVAGWRMNAFFLHSWTLASKRRARDGLPTIDLLDGGAIGYGGGVPRHRLEFGGGVIHRGIGLQVDGNVIGGSRVATGTLDAPDQLRFAARALVDARLFVNLGPQLPGRAWAKGARISFGVENMFDSKTRVRDRAGDTPIGYQPYLIDPLGRTVTLALRKVF